MPLGRYIVIKIKINPKKNIHISGEIIVKNDFKIFTL